jgi:thioredoxin 1
MSSAKDITVAEWDAEVAESTVPVVVDFWAPWCGPCRVVGPELDKLAERVGDSVKFVKVNIDENRELAVRYGVMSIPTIAKFVGGTMAAQVVGARGADALGQELDILGS